MNKESALPYQSNDFIVASRKNQLFSGSGTSNAPISFLPIAQKLSLHKNKKKRQGLTDKEIKRSFINDSTTGKVRPQKISDHLPDKYVIAPRGYTNDEAHSINKEYATLHCDIQVNKDSIVFTDTKVVREVEKSENKYMKSVFKKPSKK
jgi:hypothetical protein